jgi:hypothetical protein
VVTFLVHGTTLGIIFWCQAPGLEAGALAKACSHSVKLAVVDTFGESELRAGPRQCDTRELDSLDCTNKCVDRSAILDGYLTHTIRTGTCYLRTEVVSHCNVEGPFLKMDPCAALF